MGDFVSLRLHVLISADTFCITFSLRHLGPLLLSLYLVTPRLVGSFTNPEQTEVLTTGNCLANHSLALYTFSSPWETLQPCTVHVRFRRHFITEK